MKPIQTQWWRDKEKRRVKKEQRVSIVIHAIPVIGTYGTYGTYIKNKSKKNSRNKVKKTQKKKMLINYLFQTKQ